MTIQLSDHKMISKEIDLSCVLTQNISFQNNFEYSLPIKATLTQDTLLILIFFTAFSRRVCKKEMNYQQR